MKKLSKRELEVTELCGRIAVLVEYKKWVEIRDLILALCNRIELDAYKAGMSEAARMCCASTKEESSRLWELRAITRAENKKAHELSDAILTARDNKTAI